ncbi:MULTISPECIES: folate-binding protein YgfZ [unclassified Saccharibacter]|uniref:CAF17-like 4Fe-4S cluster assembly/insertion protein YgfZ n=1 Tax=unclassified Saccharibacter TaxID=2648722 RepID=UPI0013230919|nr:MULTISPECIES: folate-binding protein YgfZ [unclassified Saccharibacter]MXV35325.1 folate-binding protein [Saccharibacter sp. EH611]MXV57827.1 folate-binding protein [Saccharibacter sp. EH70]MXV65259.1 folate-binding protein [Saccharibacter sp. EH60]
MMKRNHLSHRSVLSLTGKERLTFLQGLITNDVLSLKNGEIRWAALLNAQGRIQSLFFVFGTPDALFLDLPDDHAETVMKQLKRFRLRADVTIELTSLAVFVGSCEDPLPSHALCCAPDPRHPRLGWRALADYSSEGNHEGEGAFQRRRLELGIPEMTDLGTPGQTLALEANLDALNGVSWEKGCYLGQEVTARMHYRAHAKRRLLPIILPDDASFSYGDDIFSHDQHIGTLRSTCGLYGLAMVHRDAWNSNYLNMKERTIQLVWPEWLPTTLRPEKG